MNAVFTIVAKNFLPQARTLGDSIKQIYPDMPFHILLVDEVRDDWDLSHERYPTVEVKDIGIPAYHDMAFKYDLVEFATSTKPFFFNYLFERYGYNKIIYLDPDIYVYNKLDSIFDALESHFIVLTPHVIDIARSGQGAISEESILFVGTYNLGFIGLNSSKEARTVVDWWKSRLSNKGYADRWDALHVDQKWMDLIPGFFDKGVLISRHPGMNVSHWNMHERELTVTSSGYYLNDQPLIFFHFSGFDPKQPDQVTGTHKQSSINLHNKPEYRRLFEAYAENLTKNQDAVSQLSYTYNQFDNGVRIFAFHRRLYRKLTECQFRFDAPFSVTPGSFYDLLKKNRLLIVSDGISGEFRQKDIPNARAKLKLLKRGLVLLKKVIGIRYYHLLLRSLLILCRPEEQAFLFETLQVDAPGRFGMIPDSVHRAERTKSID